jgi:thioredoxin reductase (NADPH)
MEEALFLTRFGSKVTVIHRRDQLRASKIMQERAFSNEKIEILWNHVVVEVLGENEVTGLKVKNVKSGEESEIPVGALFVAIGHTPNTDVFQGQLEQDEQGYIRVQSWNTHTSVDGVFACGDVMDRVYRQAITAAGTGCMAAIDAERWLAEQESAAQKSA